MNLEAKFSKFLDAAPLEKADSLAEFYWLLKTQHWYKRFFGHIGTGSKILNPMRLAEVQCIHIGNQVLVNKGSFLLTKQVNDAELPRMTIDDGTIIGHLNHITCVNDVYIGKKVLTADKVHISDNSHVYGDPQIPIMEQKIQSRGPVVIGDGTWIGENVSVLSCKIGRNCVIGANAVVISDIPDHCVAVGAPAHVVRRFDAESQTWQRVSVVIC